MEDDKILGDPQYKIFIQNLTNGGFFQRKIDGQTMVGQEYEDRLARATKKWNNMKAQAASIVEDNE